MGLALGRAREAPMPGTHAGQGSANARYLHFRVLGFRVGLALMRAMDAPSPRIDTLGFRVALALMRARDASMPGIYTLGF